MEETMDEEYVVDVLLINIISSIHLLLSHDFC